MQNSADTGAYLEEELFLDAADHSSSRIGTYVDRIGHVIIPVLNMSKSAKAEGKIAPVR